MALSAGTVSLSADGVATKSGLAEAIYDQFVDNYQADTGEVMPAGAASYAIKKGYMVQANRLAAAIVAYVTANAEVTGVEAEGYTYFTDNTVLCSAGGANTAGSPGGNTIAATPFGTPFTQPAGNTGTIS